MYASKNAYCVAVVLIPHFFWLEGATVFHFDTVKAYYSNSSF